MADPKDDEFGEDEAWRRFEAALRGARIVGHRPQSELKIGKPIEKVGRSRRSRTVKKRR